MTGSFPAGIVALFPGRGRRCTTMDLFEPCKCAPGVEHWHGAESGSRFVYIAVTLTQEGMTISLKPVSNRDYDCVK